MMVNRLNYLKQLQELGLNIIKYYIKNNPICGIFMNIFALGLLIAGYNLYLLVGTYVIRKRLKSKRL